MIATVNGREMSVSPALENLEELLLYMMENQKDEEIVEVRVNGERFSEAYQHQARSVMLKEINSIEITTEKRGVLAADFLKDVPSYIEMLKKGFFESVILLRNFEKEHQGYKLLAQSLDMLKAFLEHLNNVLPHLKNGEKIKMEKNYKRFLKTFAPLTEEIILSQEVADSMLLADLIEYEFIPLLDKWKEAL